MRDYGKLTWAVLGAVAFFLQAALRDGMTSDEWVGTIIAAVNAAAVWIAPDLSIASWVKSTLGGVLAALLVAQTAISGGFTSSEWLDVIVALLIGAGVVIDPRRPVHEIAGSSGAQPGLTAREAY